MLTMYKGAVNSPETTITNALSITDTHIFLLDETKVPEKLPNLMVLGTGQSAETVKVLSASGNDITVERAFQGVARVWQVGTVIARNFTEYDYRAMTTNIEENNAQIINIAEKLDPDTPIEHVQTLTSVQSLPDGALDGAVTGLEIEGLSLINLIENGNFRDGINEWAIKKATFSDLSLSIKLDFTSVTGEYLIQNIGGSTTDKIFVAARVKSDSSSAMFGITGGSVLHSGSGDYEMLSKISNVSTNMNVGFSTASEICTIEIDKTFGVFAINMTQLGIENYTEEQMLELVRGGYIDGLQGVSKPSIKIVGKNLLKNLWAIGDYSWHGNPIASTDRIRTAKLIPIKPKTSYILSGEAPNGYQLNSYDKNKNPVAWSTNNGISATNNTPFTTPSNCYYLNIVVRGNINIDSKYQLEKGISATPYEPYRSSTLTTAAELRSLPNGIKDRIFMQDGQLMFEKKVGLLTSKQANWQYHESSSSTYSNYFDSKGSFKNLTALSELGAHIPFQTENIYKIRFKKALTVDERTKLYQKLSAFYQLATPELINLTEQGLTDGILESIKCGTCFVDSDTFIPPFVKFSVPTDLGAQVSSLLSGQNALSKAVGAKADRVQGEWIEPTLLNGTDIYEDYERPCYKKDEFGRVSIKGFCKMVPNGTTLFVLPEGYRPSATSSFICSTNNVTVVRVSVMRDGRVMVHHNVTDVFFSLHLTFIAAGR